MVNSKIAIQPAAHKELAGFRALIHTIFLETEGYVEPSLAVQFDQFSLDFLSAKCAKDPVSLLIARLEGNAVGFAILTDQMGPVWLDWYGVRSSARGVGVGKALLTYIISECAERFATKLCCAVLPGNASSNGIMAHLGFANCGIAPNRPFDQDYTLWEKTFPQQA